MPTRAKISRSKPGECTPKENQRSGQMVARPNWPTLQPLLPASDLEMTSIMPGQIIIVPKLWTASLCKAYVSFLSTLPLVTTPGKPKKGEALRVNDRFQIDDPIFAENLWKLSALESLLQDSVIDDAEPLDAKAKLDLWGGEILGLNSNIRIYRYSKGQYFDQHYDDSNNVMFPSAESANSIPARTTWTLLLYLSSTATGCEGGETVFYPMPANKREPAPAPIVAAPEVGMALLHRHGKECMLHEGREVTAGEKWIIRSDLCVKR